MPKEAQGTRNQQCSRLYESTEQPSDAGGQAAREKSPRIEENRRYPRPWVFEPGYKHIYIQSSIILASHTKAEPISVRCL